MSVADTVQATATILKVAAVAAAAYVAYRLFTSEQADSVRDVYEEARENLPETRDTSPVVGDDAAPGFNAATDFAILETYGGTALVAALIPDPVEEQSQVGREQPYPNYDPSGFDPDIYGWERISRPNYTGGAE